MPSQFETIAADDWDRCFTEFQQTVIRRIGGRDDRTEPVVASVDFDEKLSAKVAVDRGGLVDGPSGRHIDEAGFLDIPATQEFSMNDTWVIDGQVYRTYGESAGRDAACTTLVIFRRTNKLAREPRVSR